MQKKILIALFMFLTLSFISQTQVFAQSYLLGMIEVNFCNYEQKNTEIDMVAKAGKKQDICVALKNKGDIPITLNLEFLDSIVTSDTIQNRTCNASDRPKMYFGNFILPYTGKITIPPKSEIQKIYQIKYPIGYSGLSHGCLAYYVIGSDIGDSEMFTVRIRAVKFIDMFVGNTNPIQVIKVSQSPKIKKTNEEYSISFSIKNKGNVPEKLHITSTLSNMFGYYKEFTFDAIVGANTGMIFTTPNFIMPVYGGIYQFKSKISYVPQFDFNIIEGKHPSTVYTGGTKKTQTLFFVRSRELGVIIGIFGLIIAKILYKKKKTTSRNKAGGSKEIAK